MLLPRVEGRESPRRGYSRARPPAMRTEPAPAETMPFEKERRRHPRFAVDDLPVLVGDGEALRVRDLSRSGACFFSENPVRVMTHVRFAFELPGGQPAVEGEGVVVRCERISPAVGHYEVAIFFQDLPAESAARLEEYLSSLSAA